MADTIFGNGSDQWVCPNDRQLALRAKLQTGWSVHTNQTDKQRKTQGLNPKELEVILEVIRRAEKLDLVEQQRIGRLVERLENMRKNVMGNGLSQCLLCGELLGLLGTTSVFCQDCKKVSFLASCFPINTQEVWKRSGAWFYKGLPKYIMPLKTTKTNELRLRPRQAEPDVQEVKGVGTNRSYTWARGRGQSLMSSLGIILHVFGLKGRACPVAAPPALPPQHTGGSGPSCLVSGREVAGPQSLVLPRNGAPGMSQSGPEAISK
uniref:RabBD domain-containing protein n=1 Tax=Chelonoidis abingdonii TaxID=106734 RepID=A0A8C0JEU3_CHEAB